MPVGTSTWSMEWFNFQWPSSDH